MVHKGWECCGVRKKQPEGHRSGWISFPLFTCVCGHVRCKDCIVEFIEPEHYGNMENELERNAPEKYKNVPATPKKQTRRGRRTSRSGSSTRFSPYQSSQRSGGMQTTSSRAGSLHLSSSPFSAQARRPVSQDTPSRSPRARRISSRLSSGSSFMSRARTSGLAERSADSSDSPLGSSVIFLPSEQVPSPSSNKEKIDKKAARSPSYDSLFGDSDDFLEEKK